ncbi:unnamed protein product [Pleuronectes platessa]|uniref:Uncharacterized protein n=1 Tax=Pleuronectes platessa TaxID=8262 RepID=A0A9N7UTM2_PLEPL|nr:unnamed protein product [Pleuronectes platessa]
MAWICQIRESIFPPFTSGPLQIQLSMAPSTEIRGGRRETIPADIGREEVSTLDKLPLYRRDTHLPPGQIPAMFSGKFGLGEPPPVKDRSPPPTTGPRERYTALREQPLEPLFHPPDRYRWAIMKMLME